MNNDIIKKYASNIEKKDIIEFAKKEGISITEEEVSTLHSVIKNNADEILSADFYSYIAKYKSKFSAPLYNKIIEKYEKYKGFIN